MKIFDTQNIRKADQVTIDKQGITSLELMERAATQVFLWLKKKFPDKETVYHFFCGQGNNGGDGLAVARMLKQDGYLVYLNVMDIGKATADFLANRKRIKDEGLDFEKSEEISSFGKGKTVVVDALFGTGLSRELEDEYKAVIGWIHRSGALVISIDVPSGMFMDRPTPFAVKSDYVLTFQFPKLAFYLPINQQFVKEVVIVDIGLDNEFIADTHTGYYLTDKADAFRRYRPVPLGAHKGTQGHALIVGGSYGKIGALCLSAKAALKAGCGLVTAYLPKCGYNIIQTAFPEAMAITNGKEHLEKIEFNLEPKAIGIGMGMGQEPQTREALHDFLQHNKAPLVIDADALNILSQNKEWLDLLPEGTILTPHPKELERLMGPWDDDFEKVEKIKAFAKTHNIVLVAKDAFTLISCNDRLFINPTGNAALATGGSGDVLTGIITGLLAQSYPALDAAIFGVYLHGLTANIGSCDIGIQAFTASSILEYMGKAFLEVETQY